MITCLLKYYRFFARFFKKTRKNKIKANQHTTINTRYNHTTTPPTMEELLAEKAVLKQTVAKQQEEIATLTTVAEQLKQVINELRATCFCCFFLVLLHTKKVALKCASSWYNILSMKTLIYNH